MRTALVHEWFSPHGGSENVADLLTGYFDADVFTLWFDEARQSRPPRLAESWLARTPLRRHKAAALPFMPRVWRHLDLAAYDRVVCSTHLFAHQAAANPTAAHARRFVYVHTPGRYIWAPEQDLRGDTWWARAASGPLKAFDRSRVARDASFAANSAYIADRVTRAWGVEARVVHPPVQVGRIQSSADWTAALPERQQQMFADLPEAFVLGASRLISYKEVEQAVYAGEDLGLPVVIAGSGPDEARLRGIAAAASVPVAFMGSLSQEALFALYQRASLFVFAAVEDFGIMPVEAMAAGTPVLVNERGGASEAVAVTGGGVATGFRSPADRKAAAERAMALDAAGFAARARAFDEPEFRARIEAWVA